MSGSIVARSSGAASQWARLCLACSLIMLAAANHQVVMVRRVCSLAVRRGCSLVASSMRCGRVACLTFPPC